VVRAALPRILAVLLGSTTIVSVYGLVAHALAGGGLMARVRGISGFYLTVAGILMIVALLSLALAEALFREGRRGRRSAALVGVAGLVTALALGGTYARGSWLGFAAGALVLARKRRGLVGALAAALVLGYAVAPAPLKERVRSTFDSHHPLNQERLVIWQHGLSLFTDHPWTGVGLVIPERLMRHEVMTEHGLIRVHSHMHNAFLQVAVTMGIPGLAAFAFLIVSFFRLGRRAARAPTRNPWEAGVAAAYPAILVALLANGMVEWNFGDSEILGLFYLVSGFVLGIEAGAPPAAEPRA
jgi:O-antigen ligase